MSIRSIAISFMLSTVPYLIHTQEPKLEDFPLFYNYHDVSDLKTSDDYDLIDKGHQDFVESLLNEIGDKIKAEGLRIYEYLPYKTTKSDYTNVGIRYFYKRDIIIAEKDYILKRFAKKIEELFLIDYEISEGPHDSNVEDIYYKAAFYTYYTCMFDFVHEVGHRYLDRFQEDSTFRNYSDNQERELNFLKLDHKDEALADYFAGTYFKNFDSFFKLNGRQSKLSFNEVLAQYIFSLGNLIVGEEHPMMSTRLSLFMYGLFNGNSVVYWVDPHYNAFKELVRVALLFGSSKSEIQTYDCDLLSNLGSFTASSKTRLCPFLMESSEFTLSATTFLDNKLVVEYEINNKVGFDSEMMVADLFFEKMYYIFLLESEISLLELRVIGSPMSILEITRETFESLFNDTGIEYNIVLKDKYPVQYKNFLKLIK